MTPQLTSTEAVNVYVVRHKATGELMPSRMCKRNGGWSFWLPGQTVSQPHDASPRVFLSKRAAANAVSAWERGMWGFHERRGGRPVRTESSGLLELTYTETELRPEPHPDRRPGDLEVVEAELRLWRN